MKKSKKASDKLPKSKVGLRDEAIPQAVAPAPRPEVTLENYISVMTELGNKLRNIPKLLAHAATYFSCLEGDIEVRREFDESARRTIGANELKPTGFDRPLDIIQRTYGYAGVVMVARGNFCVGNVWRTGDSQERVNFDEVLISTDVTAAAQHIVDRYYGYYSQKVAANPNFHREAQRSAAHAYPRPTSPRRV